MLPYIGKPSEKLQARVREEMKQHGVNLRSAYRTTKVGSYLSLKTKIPKLFRTDVVYIFQCPGDKDCHYIGETQRQFYKRISDHVPGISKQSNMSAVHDHILACATCSSHANLVDCFSLLRSCGNMDVLSEEALCIKKFRPSLNVQMGPYKGSRVPTNIFD